MWDSSCWCQYKGYRRQIGMFPQSLGWFPHSCNFLNALQHEIHKNDPWWVHECNFCEIIKLTSPQDGIFIPPYSFTSHVSQSNFKIKQCHQQWVKITVLLCGSIGCNNINKTVLQLHTHILRRRPCLRTHWTHISIFYPSTISWVFRLLEM